MEGRSGLNGGRMIKVMWVSGFFYGASVLSKSVTELAFSFADVLHVTFIALDYVNEIGYAMLMSPNRGEQLSMTATVRVIWLCTCVRYWPARRLVYMCPLL